MSLTGNAEKDMLFPKLTGKIRYVPELDTTLTKPDKAANAKATGDAIARVEAKADMMVPNVSKNVIYDRSKSNLDAENVQDAIDELSGTKSGRAYMWSTSITNGNTGECTFDITPYENDRCIGMITVCGSENKTRMAVVAWGKNFTCDLKLLVLSASEELNITLENNVIKVTVTSGGIWGADMALFRTPAKL